MKHFAVLLPLLLAACVSKYQLPANTDSATISLHVVDYKPMDKVRVQVYEDETCTKSERGNRLAYFFMNAYDSQSAGALKVIAADKEFIYTFVSGSGGHCAVTAKFMPVKGARYKSYFGARGCTVSLEEEVTTNANEKQLRRVPSFMILKMPCLNNLTD
jgi:hypothetical protein